MATWIRYTVALLLTFSLAAHAQQNGPKIEHWKTDNGASVYFVAAPELPIIDIRVVFDAGSAHETGKGGVAILTNGLLDQGAGDLDANAIAERFENLGARVGTSAHRDMAVVSLRSLVEEKFLDPALDTFSLIISQPSYPKESLERERQRLLLGLKARKESLDNISDNAFYAAIYGDHPYARDTFGTEASVKSITRNDIIDYHSQFYVANNATVAIVGAITKKQAKDIADRVMKPLPQGKAAFTLPKVEPLKEARRVDVKHPSQQTHLVVGQPGVRRGDPDYFALYVGNHILGGSGLVSRLAEEIREKRGLSYSQYSFFSPMRLEGPYIMGLQTRNDQAEEALTLLKQLLRDYIAKGPSEDELKAAKQNITGSFPLRIASNTRIVEYIASIGFYGLPLDYLDTFNANINAVTAEQIRDAYKRRIFPDKLVSVVAGGAIKHDSGS